MPMTRLPSLVGLAGALLLVSCAAPSAPDVAAAPPAPEPAALRSTIVEGLAASPLHARFLDLLRAARLENTLAGAGPYTVFAPTDRALERLPNGALESLRAPQSGALLAGVVNYHVVSGLKTPAQIARDAGGGAATYRTVHGGLIRVSIAGGRVTVADHHGNRNAVVGDGQVHADGVLYVLDGVLLPQT